MERQFEALPGVKAVGIGVGVERFELIDRQPVFSEICA